MMFRFDHSFVIFCHDRELAFELLTQVLRKHCFFYPHPFFVEFTFYWPRICYFFLNKMILTTFVISSVVLNSLGDILFEYPEWLLSDFFFGEVISDNILNDFVDVFVALSKIFDEFIKNHWSKLLSLLNSLSLFDGRM